MLYSVNDTRKCKIAARDGELGRTDDFFFDDRSWLIRYVVVDTGRWLPGKRVLVPRETLGEPNWNATSLEVDLTREEIEKSPGIESDPPLAHDEKLRYYRSYVWLSYPWGGFIGGAPATEPSEHEVTEPSRTHIRSAREVIDYRIEAADKRIGHVEDFLFSGEDWSIRYVVIDTRNWLPGKKVVVPPREIARMEWPDQTAHVNLTSGQVEKAPRLDLANYAKDAHGPRLIF